MKKVISAPDAPAAIGPHSQAIAFGDVLITSGQLGLNPQSSAFASKDVLVQTEQVFRNLKAILDEVDFTFDQVIKTICFLTNMGDFAAMNAVCEKRFPGAFPARSAVAVKTPPESGLVEIEMITRK